MENLKIDNQAIIDAYNEGQSMNAIANAFGTYATSVKRILKKHNVPLRHDSKTKGSLYVRDGKKLIEWAKAQGRPVTKAELAAVIGTKRLSPSYFIKYPELGQYVETHEQKENQIYIQKLHSWLKENNIMYKPNDKSKIGVTVDVLLLGEYSNIALQIDEKPQCVSKNRHTTAMNLKLKRATEAGVSILFLNKEHFECLDDIKPLLDAFKK